MRCAISLGLLAVFLLPALHAQTFTIKPVFTVGQQVELEVAKRRSDRGRKFSATNNVTIEVVRADENGAVLTLASTASVVQGAPEDVLRAIRAAERAMLDVVLRAKFDADGAYQGLENEDEVAAAVRKATDDMLADMAGQYPPEVMEQVRGMMAQMVSPEVALQSASEIILLYFGMAGVEVTPGRVERTQIELPSPFGGVLESNVEVRVVQVDEGLNQAVLRVLSKPTPESATELVKSAVRRMAPAASGVQVESALASMQVSIEDHSEYQLDLPTHWMRYVDFARTMTVNGVRRIDQTTMRIVRVGPAP